MSIEAAYARSRGNLREMFALYGGRGASDGLDGDDDGGFIGTPSRYAREFNRRRPINS
jgi:hypothetical protein